MTAEVDVASFEKFNYLLRPSKQVERKLFIEALHELTKVGYDIANYTYLGLGSIYYADFILFHKYLYVRKMICTEMEDIPKRMKFNLPFDFIDLRMRPVSDIFPELDRKTPHLVWLDYDRLLDSSILMDVGSCLQVLCPRSFIIVTVEAEPRLPTRRENSQLSEKDRLIRLVEILNEDLGPHYRGNIDEKLLSHNDLPRLFVSVLREAFKKGVSTRKDLEFYQLFNFRYADGAQMLSYGGLIDCSDADHRLKQSGIYDMSFIKTDTEPIRISVPPLTMREKLWLDQQMPGPLSANELEFELPEDHLKNFTKYYKHYPTYYETLL